MHPGRHPAESQQVQRRLEALADELASIKQRTDQIHRELALYWDDLMAIGRERASIAATIQRLKSERQRRQRSLAQYARSTASRGGARKRLPASAQAWGAAAEAGLPPGTMPSPGNVQRPSPEPAPIAQDSPPFPTLAL